MRCLITSLLLFLSTAVLNTYAQDEQVRTYLKLAAAGKTDEVKMALPDLLAEYPNHPGVMMLHGMVIEDGEKAMEIYEKITARHPDSEWADDAYWRIVQYYAIKGDLEKARRELNNFRKNHPASEYLAPAADVVRTAERLHNSSSKPVSKPVYTEAEKPREDNRQEDETKKYVEEKQNNETAGEIEKITGDEGTYGLQVGIYSTREAAESERERFRKMRMNTEVMQKNVDGTAMYAVVIGEYSSIDSAEHAKKIVQIQCKCSPIIFKR